MKNKTIFFSFIVIASMVYSCKKDKEEPIPPIIEKAPNHSQLSVGNYWIYQHFEIDTSGNARPTNRFDRCYVEKDTLINRRIYSKVYRPYIGSSLETFFLRDSMGCIVDSNGEIHFSALNFSKILNTTYGFAQENDTVCKITRMMVDKNQAKTTPAGTFTTMNALLTYDMYPKYSNKGKTRYRDFLYADGVGVVSETLPFFVGNWNYTEARLVRYHINKPD
ncbi:MAG: hypothetical protein H0X62_10330 [Bacteroidetes bacterium]|nr:hypothetical protein [Bacteroidota bacterium]